eukprot:Plantae.Rhodophyta-Purpureofilum_apyrenoidigerum.ctg24380.p1 GENE.Plantae.Rhodophyta-Purpureofilum_apyrenoidigerum.ctg24380~~Plantae.Rhodophyta-Purpureofilum_apyrenoidigerum.ctg24380.p1  ORF type:complete len:178 (+),score=13.01 Plantae.Rhodophyta-Purpureofilum_apyrenoidigerum.ctg24380:134-667(+)
MSTSKVTPYRCDMPGCGKYFTRRFNMKSHMRWHTGACPFRCPYEDCSARFKWKSSFASHIRSHQQNDLKKRPQRRSSVRMSIMDLVDQSSAVLSDNTDDIYRPGSPTGTSNDSLLSDEHPEDTGFSTVLKVLDSPVSMAQQTSEKVLQRNHVMRDTSALSPITSPMSPTQSFTRIPI